MPSNFFKTCCCCCSNDNSSSSCSSRRFRYRLKRKLRWWCRCFCYCEDDMAPTHVNPPEAPATPVREVKASSVNGVNGARGASPRSVASPTPVYRTTSYSFRSTTSNGHSKDMSATYYIRDTANSLEKKGSAELGYGVFESISSTTYIQLVEYIANERLSSLPHRGSTW